MRIPLALMLSAGPNRCLPPEEPCLGVRPRKAANSRGPAKLDTSWTPAAIADAVIVQSPECSSSGARFHPAGRALRSCAQAGRAVARTVLLENGGCVVRGHRETSAAETWSANKFFRFDGLASRSCLSALPIAD